MEKISQCDFMRYYDCEWTRTVRLRGATSCNGFKKYSVYAYRFCRLSKIVRDRINEIDVNETERLIPQVMDKELKAIVLLGALLGLVVGVLIS